MKSSGIVVVVLSVATAAWLVASVYSVWSQSQWVIPEDESGMYITAGKLPFEPSFYWSLTNATPAASYIIEAIAHPHTQVHVLEQYDQLGDLIGRSGGYVEYLGEYYGLGVSFKEDDIIVPASPDKMMVHVAPIGFFVLGVGWISVGLNKLRKNTKPVKWN